MHDGPALRITDLRFRYGSGVAAAAPDDAATWTVSVGGLDLAPGEQVLLTGGSGTGKSTLLHVVAGLMDPHAGRVDVAGRHLHALTGAARDRFRGRHIGMIFQTFNLLHGFSAVENVLAAMLFADAVPKAERASRAAALLRTLGIDRPHAEVTRLSVGQQQRVAVARAVACKPELVLADEPTASLDPENAAAAMDLIQQTCRDAGAALLCVSHDPGMAARFARTERLADLVGPGASGMGPRAVARSTTAPISPEARGPIPQAPDL